MKNNNNQASFIETETGYRCEGSWSILNLDRFIAAFKTTVVPENKNLTIDGSQSLAFDSSGALALSHFLDYLKEHQNTITLTGFSKEQQSLLDLIESKKEALSFYQVRPTRHNPLYLLGKEAAHKAEQIDEFVILLGDLSTQFFYALGRWKRFHLPSIISIIHSAGLQALPIVGLLSFLIGVVLAYQLGIQLQTYGANIFIAYLSGMAIFREFAPLITAIIIAGRTSSSFTAQLGSMIVNEEVDAVRVMGLSPIELLVMPKVLGLLFVFPLLIFWSDVFSILGSMFMAKTDLGVGYADFLARLQDSVGIKQFRLGLYKAPAFAIIIALVGCFQGFRVQGSTDSIGVQTTKSVVQALFLIIIADAVYSVIYSWMDL